MTLHEIEETLHTLQSRHSGLNEDMLVTLLRSGGWEEKNIQEAVLLFRSGGGLSAAEAPPKKEAEPLPALEVESMLPPQVDGDHLLLEHNEDVPEVLPPPTPIMQQEPQSLIEASPEPVRSKKEELPHNLPLRPFETSDHVWPFSRYRDVFFGENESQQVPIEEKKAEVIPTEEAPPVQETAKEEGKIAVPVIPEAPVIIEKKEEIKIETPPLGTSPPDEKKQITPVPLSHGDEKLVIMAATMLVAILLLLGYMYSNGRL